MVLVAGEWHVHAQLGGRGHWHSGCLCLALFWLERKWKIKEERTYTKALWSQTAVEIGCSMHWANRGLVQEKSRGGSRWVTGSWDVELLIRDLPCVTFSYNVPTS